ncbi:hypothetical protein GJ744_003133 [Endocarpon pusillum]|uniref:Uncharacterized protein n=1 Tax=Endocarpon pusillum TaxID=364733 RepID=A0A8H7E829_9EURO|nr:hypothetical protein GJ744_003133 [Endocarpon pusillum]
MGRSGDADGPVAPEPDGGGRASALLVPLDGRLALLSPRHRQHREPLRHPARAG